MAFEARIVHVWSAQSAPYRAYGKSLTVMLVFLALICVPLIEIALFIVLGGEIGLPFTLAIVLATALVGSITLRTQGLQTFEKLRALKADQEAPVVLIEGLMIAAAGLLLLTPGFFTDAIGFLLLVPPLRQALARRAAARAILFATTGRGAGPFPDGRRTDADETSYRAPPRNGVRSDSRQDIEDATVIDDQPPGRSE